MLNAVGLQNDGVESFLKNKLPRLPWHETPVIANLYATSPAEFAELAGILAAEEDVETLIVSQDIPGNMAPEQVEQFSDVARAAVAVRAASGKPVIVVSNISGGIDPAIGDILAQGNVPVVQGSGAGIPAIRRWIDWCAARAAKTASPYPRKDSPTPSILPPELASELDASSGVLPYALSARLLRHFGIAIDHEELAVSLEEGMAAAGRIGYPVALKAASPDIAHKTETGLVKLNLRTGAEFAAAWRELEGILALHHADARREGMLVQGMVRSAGGKSGDVVETIVGVNRDGGFGSAVMVGLGGVFVELLRDVSLELAPLSPEGARAMIGRLKAAKLLTGFRRGSPLRCARPGGSHVLRAGRQARFARPEPGHGAAGRGRRTHCGHRDAGGSGTALRGNRLILMEKSR